MKTLLERAKPELIAGLEIQFKKYPSITEELRESLSKLFYVNHMQIKTWIDLKSIWLDQTGEVSNHPWDLFEED